MLNYSFWTKAQNTVAIDNPEKDLQEQGCETKKLNRDQTQGAQDQCHIMEPKERKRGEPYPIKHFQLFDLTIMLRQVQTTFWPYYRLIPRDQKGACFST